MEFYSLVNKDNDELLADIIEFENGEYVGYFHKSKELQTFINKEDMSDYIENDIDLFGLCMELFHEGVVEDEDLNDAKDILYSV